jgi:hypothetical protein
MRKGPTTRYNYNKAVEATYCDKAVSEKETRGLHPAAMLIIGCGYK